MAHASTFWQSCMSIWAYILNSVRVNVVLYLEQKIQQKSNILFVGPSCWLISFTDPSLKNTKLAYDFIFYLFILFFNFTILYWFCHISTWISHRYTRVPHPEPPPKLLSPRTIPLGRPSAPAPSIQYRASNLDWQLISYILYMFQCRLMIF